MSNSADLRSKILSALDRSSGATAREIANEIGEERKAVNQFLHGSNGISVRKDSNFRWYLHERAQRHNQRAAKAEKKNRLAAVAPEAKPKPKPQSKPKSRPNVEPIVEPRIEPQTEHAANSPKAIESDDLITNVLESLRRRLLDLTARNRLLNFRHTKTGCIRVIDELPDQLKRFLADEEKEMRFLAVPDPTRRQLIEAGHIEIDEETREEKVIHEPTAKEWAEWLGLHTSYECPEEFGIGADSKHTDNAIQTVLFPSELETRLRSMRQKANSAIEETGANILYLAIGFLEWFDSRDSDQKRLAPLCMIPVRLDRGKLNIETRTYEYRLKYSGEDILTNISLREKLQNDFAIALPELDDGVDPEEYISSVARAVSARQPEWRVRRYATLGHLNFSKQLLYLDLDPARWPEGDSIVDHPLVKQCLAGLSEEERDDSGVGSFGEEHPIDDVASVHEKYPLIDNADSSQHSALIDAVDGKNLVIEGPPGTGKSQTITNLIAAALANGQRVLFVAEKVAALEVVKRRLDQAGLGDFCLELHSHRSQKRRVLDDIGQRIKSGKRLRKPSEIEADIAIYEELKDKLRAHAALVNSKWKSTDRSIHQILAAATRFRNELAIDPKSLHPEAIDGSSFTPVERKRVIGQARSLGGVFQGIVKQLGEADSISEHPWYGVQKESLQAYEQNEIISALQGWQHELNNVVAEYDKLAQAVDSDSASLPADLTRIRKLVDELGTLPDCRGSDPLYALPKLRGQNATVFANAIQTYKAIQNYFDDLSQHLSDQLMQRPSDSVETIEAADWVATAARSDVKVVEIREGAQMLRDLDESMRRLKEAVEETDSALALTGGNTLHLSLDGLNRMTRIVELVAMLQPEYLSQRSECFDQDELDHVVPRLTSEYRLLTTQRGDLEEIFDLDSLPDASRLKEIEVEFRQAGVFSFLNGEWRSANAELKAIKASKRVRKKALKSRIEDLVEYAAKKNEFDNDEEYAKYLSGHFDGLNTDVRKISSLRAWYKAIRDEYGVGFGSTVEVGDSLLDISESLARSLRSLHKKGFSREVERISKGVKSLSEMFPGVKGLDDEHALFGSTHSAFYKLCTTLPHRFGLVDTAVLDESSTTEELEQTFAKLRKLVGYLAKWSELDICSRIFDGKIQLATGVGATDKEALDAVSRVSDIASLISKSSIPDPISQKLYREPTKATVDLIRLRNGMLREALQKESDLLVPFSERVELDRNAWSRGSDEPRELVERNRTAIENPQWLGSWLEYLRSGAQLAQLGWGNLSKAIEDGAIKPSQVDSAVMLGANDALSREILLQSPELSTFSGLTQVGMQKQFGEYDDKLRDLQRQLIAWKAARAKPPKGTGSGKVRDYSEMSLLKHEIGKKKRHIPLRQLFRRSGRAISALKPCFMMGPMSVAQYLAPGQIKFDLVVMDEASQVRPEDALGAIARGGQLVVVGDPKQLPPTSFFEKILDEEDQEEDFTAGQQSESILDAARITFPQRRLRWHYRSQHESLIAFSNHEFYGSDLVIFPSPENESPEYGVQFTRVKRGRFVNRVNREEAALIARAVRKHMLTRPDESIGVVAMSAQQREQIERAIEQETKEDAQFRDLIDQDQNRNESLFVKNLENVQGDERDVIYISMTYGPSEVGEKVAQRFGPINSIHGWRRLNVLFTRSKKRMHVFSSMGTEDIIVSPTSSRGVKSMKAFLDYAATGHLTKTIEHTGRDPDSDFEVAVADALSNHGFECVPQVGVAGYFLDIAVKDPGNDGRFLMAIECDGATYHSAKSTRDRDRLRQKILEGLGWRVRRIWSTDWFGNPEGQLAPIVKELNELKTVPRPIDDEEQEQDEVQEIEGLIEELEEDDEFVSTIVRSDEDLRTQLERFDREVIRIENPDTPEDRRFLRPAMLDALMTYLPMTTWEFQQQIPPYLREGTEPSEGRYIVPVVKIIYECEG